MPHTEKFGYLKSFALGSPMRDYLKKTTIRNRSEALMMAYRNAENQVTTLNKQLKKQYYTENFSSHEGNIKATWQTANQILNKNQNQLTLKA